jgi:hypothetical protein
MTENRERNALELVSIPIDFGELSVELDWQDSAEAKLPRLKQDALRKAPVPLVLPRYHDNPCGLFYWPFMHSVFSILSNHLQVSNICANAFLGKSLTNLGILGIILCQMRDKAADKLNKETARLPFAVARSSRTTLVDQVVEGLRRCIASGFYHAGDVLPTTRDLAEMLDVSRIVTRAAVRDLTDAGLINPRPGIGCVVLGRGDRLWRGNVLFVSRTDGRGYYVNVFTATLRTQLLKAGWLFTQVVATPIPGGFITTP